MKVKMLRDGRWAHDVVQRGQFDHKNGEIISGISEADAIKMKSAGAAEILGEDDVEENVPDEESEDDVTITSDAMKGNGEKPWSNGAK